MRKRGINGVRNVTAAKGSNVSTDDIRPIAFNTLLNIEQVVTFSNLISSNNFVFATSDF